MPWNEERNGNLTEAAELTPLLHLTPEEEAQMAAILSRYPMSVTPYYLSLIDFSDPDDPIRKMSIPSIKETDMSGAFDTSGEADNTVMAGMQHKYRETAMILSTNRCAMYCRHCFRKRLVGLSDEEIAKRRDGMFAYIRSNESISNVLISGGDAFLNSDGVIEEYLAALSGIDHLDFIRFGTRTPVVLPQRITDDPALLALLKRYGEKKQIFVVTQFNHPRELTEQAGKAVRLLMEQGVCVKNQTVLLKGINDSPQVLGKLLRGLTSWGVSPYYVFQCRPVTGVKNQFQVPLVKGYEVVEAAKNLQNGQGKCFRYAMSHVSGKIEILGRLDDGRMLFKYHQAKDPANAGRMFAKAIPEEACWLDEEQP